MSWITIVWSMDAAFCFTLAAIYLLVWCKQREGWVHLLFSCSAVAAGVIAGFELTALRTETTAQYGAILRWSHLAVWVLVVSLVWFGHLYLHAGRRWLVWSVCGLRTLVLVLNFLFTPNINYRAITSLRHLSLGGETIWVPVGVPNPWTLVSQLSSLLLLIFFVDATITAWRRGARRRAFVVGGSAIFATTLSLGLAVLVIWGVIHLPLFPSFFYLFIVAALGYELSRDVLNAAHLARDLGENQKRMTLAAEAANLGIWIRDIERNEMWATDEWRAMFGFTKSDPLSLERYLQRLHPEDREAVLRVRAEAIAGGGSYDTEHRIVLPDGRVRWIASRGRVEFDRVGKAVLVRGVSLDITVRKQSEQEAHERRGELAHLSRVTMLGELSGSLAHELNQPLTAILSNAQAAEHYLAEDAPDLAQVREILADIVAEDERAGEVIRRLHLLLKKGEIQQQALDTNEVVLEVLNLTRSDLTNQAVTVETVLAPSLPPIRGDRVQIQQVLLNLVMNACDAMADSAAKDRHLTVRTLSAGEAGVRIEVTDVGRGLPEGGAERAFERYFTTKPHGLGLGLSVCRAIVTAHGGTLGAADNAERGATFHCTLPLAKEPPRS